MRVRSVPVPLTARAFLPQAQMSDAYHLVVDDAALDAATAAHRMFGHMPWWVRVLMALRNRLVGSLGLETGREKRRAASPRIGLFPIMALTPHHVLLGLDDKHLDFRVAIDVLPLPGAGQQVTATTLVRTHNLLGRLYLAMVLPFHRVIVPALLAQVART
jgi:Protein of unknown function (DUF2867)